jgi:hypothetical protein
LTDHQIRNAIQRCAAEREIADMRRAADDPREEDAGDASARPSTISFDMAAEAADYSIPAPDPEPPVDSSPSPDPAPFDFGGGGGFDGGGGGDSV